MTKPITEIRQRATELAKQVLWNEIERYHKMRQAACAKGREVLRAKKYGLLLNEIRQADTEAR